MVRSLVALMLSCSSLGCITRAPHEAALAELEDARQSAMECHQLLYEEYQAGLEASLCHDREAELNARLAVAELHMQRDQQRLDVLHVLGAELREQMAAGELQVHRRDGLPVIALPSERLFDPDSTELSTRGEASLTKVAAVLARMSEQRFQVAGHTDDAPLDERLAWADSWQLSAEQALAVTRFLIAQGVAPGLLSAAGYGEHDPVASNDSDEGRKQNRRIELVLVPDLSDPRRE